MTTSAADEDILGAYGVHANHYITKPLDFCQFSSMLRTLENFWFEVVTLPTATAPLAPPKDVITSVTHAVTLTEQDESESVIKVLMIEDSPSDQLSIEAALSESQRVAFETTCVDRLATSKRALGQERFDVIITDLCLPDSQGIDTVKDVVKLASGIPVVVLTMIDNFEMGLDSLRYGAVDYVVKGEMSGRVLSRTIG